MPVPPFSQAWGTWEGRLSHLEGRGSACDPAPCPPRHPSPLPGLAGPALRTLGRQGSTCVVDDEAGTAHGCVTAEGEEEAVAATLDAAWELGAIEASYERAERVPSIVDMEEVIARLQVKAGE